MKKIYRYFFAAVAIASAAACAEQMEDNSTFGTQNTPADFAQMTISASLGEVTKTTYNDQNVLWEGTESITVFSKGSEGNPQEFEMTWCAEDKTEAAFSGLADLNAETYYAVYPHSATNACTADGVLTVNIPSAQTAVAGGFASGANVSVAAWQNADMSSENDIIFNNVCSLLSFGFETDADAVLTRSVTIKVKKNDTEYYKIAGSVSVNYAQDGSLEVSEGTNSSVVLSAPSGGFAKGVTYYVLVAPVGQIAEMELTYNHTDKTTTCTRSNNNILASLNRSALVPLDIIPVAYDDLPQGDFEVPIDFTESWPLYAVKTGTVECLSMGSQSSDGNARDEYEVLYKYDNETHRLPMLIYKNKGRGYEYVQGKGLMFHGPVEGKDTGLYQSTFHLPIIPGRYIDKVVLEYILPDGHPGSDQALRFYNGEKSIMGNIPLAGVESETEGFVTFDLPYTDANGKEYGKKISQDFRINGRYNAGWYFKKVVITYTKNIPVASN